ncbi:MAG TPA: PAS domain S-box protein, partial [Anaerolineae bacterium]|nr:PAS domain S-box protein [Anaerolineae bacterium]
MIDLKESTLLARLDLILDTIADAVIIVDDRARVVFANSAVERILGVARDTIIGHPWRLSFKITTPAGIPMPEEETPLARALRKGEIIRNFEHIHEYPDGKRKVLSVNVMPVRSETGSVIGAIISIDDITDRKRVEEALREGEKRYRTLFKTAGDAIFILDAEGDNVGKVISANQAAADMHDYTMEELLSLNIKDLDTPESARKMPERIKRMLSGEKIEFEVEHRKKDGAVFPVQVHASLLELDEHKYILSFDRDITESRRAKKLSDALNELNAVMNSTLNVDEIMRRVVVESTKAIGAETAAIIMRENRFWVARYVYGFPPELIGTRFKENELTSLALAAQKREPVIINDVYSGHGLNQQVAHLYSVRSLLSIPLIVKGEVVGTLNFYNRSAVMPFNEDQKDFASKLSTS